MTATLNLTKPIQWSESKEETLFFEVKEQKTFLDCISLEPVETGYKTLFKPSEFGKSGVIIATVSNDYQVVENQTLHDIIMDYDPVELKLNPKLSNCFKSKRTQLVYDVDVFEDFGGDDSDGELEPQLVVKNSYDGSTCVELEFGFFRSICGNGLVFPMVGQTFKMKKKHQNINGDLPQMVHGFLDEILKKETFDRIRDKIIKAKEQKVTRIDYSLLKSLPNNQLFPFIFGLYSTRAPVLISRGTESFGVSDSLRVNHLLSSLIFDKTKDKSKTIKTIASQWAKAGELKYNEDIKNKWQVFNFLIKLVQYKVSQNRRLQLASDLARRML